MNDLFGHDFEQSFRSELIKAITHLAPHDSLIKVSDSESTHTKLNNDSGATNSPAKVLRRVKATGVLPVTIAPGELTATLPLSKCMRPDFRVYFDLELLDHESWREVCGRGVFQRGERNFANLRESFFGIRISMIKLILKWLSSLPNGCLITLDTIFPIGCFDDGKLRYRIRQFNSMEIPKLKTFGDWLTNVDSVLQVVGGPDLIQFIGFLDMFVGMNQVYTDEEVWCLRYSDKPTEKLIVPFSLIRSMIFEDIEQLGRHTSHN